MAKTARPAAEREIIQLREQLDKHNYQYYVLDDPAISDTEYDRLFRQLVEWKLSTAYTARRKGQRTFNQGPRSRVKYLSYTILDPT